MAKLNAVVSEQTLLFLQDQAAEGGHATLGEYLDALAAAEAGRKGRQAMGAALVAGLEDNGLPPQLAAGFGQFSRQDLLRRMADARAR